MDKSAILAILLPLLMVTFVQLERLRQRVKRLQVALYFTYRRLRECGDAKNILHNELSDGQRAILYGELDRIDKKKQGGPWPS